MKKTMTMLIACMMVAGMVQAVDWKTIKANEKAMTEAQFKQFCDQQVKGQSVWWSGWVKDVEPSNGAYSIKVDMDPPGTLFSVPEIWLEGVSEYNAMRLKKGQKITFSGSISDVSSVIYLSLKIRNPTIQ
jgi:hypothetical protein